MKTDLSAPATFFVGDTIEVTREELEANHIARFRDLKDCPETFADADTPNGKRQHFHVISEGNHLGPSPITTPHNFHMSYMEVPPGHYAELHAHDGLEIFIVLTGRFEIRFGKDGAQSVELGQYDTISVPAGLLRTFRNIGQISGMMIVLYDGPGRVLDKIYVSHEQAAMLRTEQPEIARKIGIL